MLFPRTRGFVALVALVVVGGCAGAGAFGRGKTQTAEDAYNEAMEDLQDGIYPEALRGFAGVKAKFPYSRFAALADLRVADTHFEQGKHVEAIDAYRQFVKLHPNHDDVPYAMLRIGDAYFEQAPDDWWFLPPSAEKDQANVKLAITAYDDLVERYPKSEQAAKGREALAVARRRLAEHELYVAKFYWKREKYRAAANRAEGLVTRFSGLGFDVEALWLAARAHAKAGETTAARAAAQRLVDKFPQSAEAGEAQSLLRELTAGGMAAKPQG